MKNILLVQMSHNVGDAPYAPDAYPLGLGYLCNVLRDKGYAVKVADLWAHPEDRRFLEDCSQYDAIGFSFYITQVKQLRSLVNVVRKNTPDIPVIVGGPGVNHDTYDILFEILPVDYLVFEEAEVSLPNLLDAIFDNKSLHDVLGIAFKNDMQIVKTEKQPYIKELDLLAFPDREVMDFDAYTVKTECGIAPQWVGKRVANMIAGRGCPFKCSFCSRTFSGARFRSVANILEEARFLKEHYGVSAIQFNDELVVTSAKRVYELCDGLRELGLEWGCQGRTNLITREMLQKMKQSGCVYIGYGFESAYQPILEAMNKKTNAEKYVDIYKMTIEEGISPVIQYMYGFIGECEESLQATAEFFRKIDHLPVGFFTQPIPGTELYGYCLKNGLITDEVAFLDDFDTGYNKGECIVNLTKFASIEEFQQAVRRMQGKVTKEYYMRHPVEAFGIFMNVLKTHKTGIFKKVVRKFFS